MFNKQVILSGILPFISQSNYSVGCAAQGRGFLQNRASELHLICHVSLYCIIPAPELIQR